MVTDNETECARILHKARVHPGDNEEGEPRPCINLVRSTSAWNTVTEKVCITRAAPAKSCLHTRLNTCIHKYDCGWGVMQFADESAMVFGDVILDDWLAYNTSVCVRCFCRPPQSELYFKVRCCVHRAHQADEAWFGVEALETDGGCTIRHYNQHTGYGGTSAESHTHCTGK